MTGMTGDTKYRPLIHSCAAFLAENMYYTIRSVKCIREPLCAIIQNFTMFIQQQLTNTNGPATKRITFSSVQLNNPEAMMNKLVQRFTAVLLIIQPSQVRIWFTCISILSWVYTPNLGIYHKTKLHFKPPFIRTGRHKPIRIIATAYGYKFITATNYCIILTTYYLTVTYFIVSTSLISKLAGLV